MHSFKRTRSIDIEVSGHTGGASIGVALRGDVAFLALGHELAILDLDAPEGPQCIGYAQLPSNQAIVEGDLVYVSSLSGGSADCFPPVIERARMRGALVASNPGIRQLSGRTGAFLDCLDKIDILTLNPTAVDASSVAFLSLEEQSGSGDVTDVEVGPNTANLTATLVLYDNLEIPTSLPDHTVRCADFTSMVPGDGLIPDSISVDSSGFLRLKGLNNQDGEFVYAVHGQAVGSFGGSNYGKYTVTSTDQ